MAEKEITPVKAAVNALTKIELETATSASAGFSFKMPKMSDEYVVVIIENTDSATKKVTVKAPTNGGYAAVSSDLVESLAAGEKRVFRLESARYANKDGSVKIVPEAATVKVGVIY